VGSAILLWFYFRSGLAVQTDSKSSAPELVHSH
jgi:hypothetical protein